MNTTAVDTLSFSQCEYHLLPAQKPPHVALLRPSAYSTETASLMMMMVTMVMSLRLLLLLMLLSVSLLLIVLWLLLLLLQLLCLPRLLFLLFLSFMLGDNYGKDLSSQHTRTHTHTHRQKWTPGNRGTSNKLAQCVARSLPRACAIVLLATRCKNQ